MVYVQFIAQFPPNKVPETWQLYEDKVMKWDKQCVEKEGGKYIAYWYTEYGSMGEVTFLVAYPNLEARERVLTSFIEDADAETRKAIEEWMAYISHVTVKVMRPLSQSPLQ